MTRTITAAAQTAAEDTVVRPVAFVHLALDSGAIYVNSSDRTITYNGNDYLGVGRLGAISAIQESASLQATGIRLALTGILSAYVSTVLSENYQGRSVKVYQGFLDANYALIADPILQFEGLIDQMSIVLGETATITLTAENKLIRWETAKIQRYTDSDQQKRFPGDLGLQFVAQTVEKEILWGRARK